jgi:CPA1 family monovalent cation:H+ antiporter
VVSLFRDLAVPKRLELLIDGESLLNDGTAITLFEIVLAAVVTGGLHLMAGVLEFVVTMAGALVIGAAVGFSGSLLLRVIESAQVQVTATVVAAYGAYLLADHFAVSGAIAVVVTGLLFGNYGTTHGVRPTSIHALSSTWEFLGFVANSLIFLLIGIELDPLALARTWWPIAAAFAAAVVARACATYLLLPWLRGAQRVPWAYYPVVVWGGLRGAVSLALVLSLPLVTPDGHAFPERSTLQLLAFGVVGVSLVLQGLTMHPVIQGLGLAREKRAEADTEALRARLRAVEGALLALEREHELGDVRGLRYERLRNAYQAEYDALAEQVQHLPDEEQTRRPE